MKKEVHFLEAPPHDPFLVSSDMDVDLLRKYAYLEQESYKRYKRRERLHVIAIILMCLFLAGIIVWLAKADLTNLDNWIN